MICDHDAKCVGAGQVRCAVVALNAEPDADLQRIRIEPTFRTVTRADAHPTWWLQVDDQHVVVCVTLVTEPDDRDLMDPEDIPPYP